MSALACKFVIGQAFWPTCSDWGRRQKRHWAHPTAPYYQVMPRRNSFRASSHLEYLGALFWTSMNRVLNVKPILHTDLTHRFGGSLSGPSFTLRFAPQTKSKSNWSISPTEPISRMVFPSNCTLVLAPLSVIVRSENCVTFALPEKSIESKPSSQSAM